MAGRPNYELAQNPVYDEAISALIHEDKGDAEVFNRVFTALLNNTHFCKLLLDAVKLTADAAVPSAQKGAANGVATLDGGGRLAQMPTAAEVGARPAGWTPGAGEVGAVPVSRRVNGKELSGDISIAKGDVGLGSVDNTRDADKRVSYADSAGSAGSAGYANTAGSAPANGGNANYANSAGSAPANGGNSDTVDGIHFSYSGQGGQPSWLWGSTDGRNSYVWNPSNFSVNYANSSGWAGSAGNSDTADGMHFAIMGSQPGDVVNNRVAFCYG